MVLQLGLSSIQKCSCLLLLLLVLLVVDVTYGFVLNPQTCSKTWVMSLSNADVNVPDYNPLLDWKLSPVAFSLLPLAPGSRRKTMMEEVVKGTIWTFDQIQGVVNVNTPVRSTVIRLKSGGLFVYNPVGPTPEYIEMIRGLEKRFGPVKYIVLGSLGLEHKAFTGPFSQYFNQAEIFLQPGQWSFPINLPSRLFGFAPFADIKEVNISSFCNELTHLSI